MEFSFKHFVVLLIVVDSYCVGLSKQTKYQDPAKMSNTTSTVSHTSSSGDRCIGQQPPEPIGLEVPVEEPAIIVKRSKKPSSKAVEKVKPKAPLRGRDNANTRTGPSLIADIKAKLNGFTGGIKDRVDRKLTALSNGWDNLEDGEKEGIVGVLDSVVGNIEQVGNAGNDPKAAVQGAINIVSSVASMFGPTGEMLSIGLSFVSGLLGLFGKGPAPKPLAEVVREQMDQALADYRYELLQDMGLGLINVYTRSLAFLEGPLTTDEPINEWILTLVACRVNLDQGDIFLDELGAVINRRVADNRYQDVRTTLAAFEIYANLAAFKDMILTQMLTLSTGVSTADANGLSSALRTHRFIAKGVLQPLFTVNLASKILPYFDPGINVITDTYGVNVAGVTVSYDRDALSGLYCLSMEDEQPNKDLVWSTTDPNYLVDGQPYLTLMSRSNANCYWKLVPRGDNVYSIFAIKGCNQNQYYCGSLLSFHVSGNNGFANIKKKDGYMWEIERSTIGSKYRIRSKWPCHEQSSSNHGWCNRELRLVHTERTDCLPDPGEPCITTRTWIGKVLQSDGGYRWTLRQAT